VVVAPGFDVVFPVLVKRLARRASPRYFELDVCVIDRLSEWQVNGGGLAVHQCQD